MRKPHQPCRFEPAGAAQSAEYARHVLRGIRPHLRDLQALKEAEVGPCMLLMPSGSTAPQQVSRQHPSMLGQGRLLLGRLHAQLRRGLSATPCQARERVLAESSAGVIFGRRLLLRPARGP